MAEKLNLDEIDLSVYTIDELVGLSRRIDAEYQRQHVLEMIPEQIDEQIKKYQDAAGTTRDEGAAWVQPTGALDAYPAGAEVMLNGKTYVSQIPANVWKPADPSDPQSARWWKEKTDGPTEAPATGGTPAWDGNGHTYKVGDTVTYQGATYKVLQAHTSQAGWTPAAVASLYAKA